jgi:Ca-activated chloride channel family protein
MMKPTPLFVSLLSAGLIAGCAKNAALDKVQTQVDGLKAEVSSARGTAEQALSAAQNAEAAANKAAAASQRAESAIGEKLDRSFGRHMAYDDDGRVNKASVPSRSAPRSSPTPPPPSSAPPQRPAEVQSPYYQDQGRDKFQEIKENPVKVTKEEPVSTFSIDVDTASYGFVRAALNQNVLPQQDAVRVEELINYFPYDYAGPDSKEEPFKANVSVFPTPWNTHTKLVHIGIKGYRIEPREKPRSNLVFLIDTSGSMDAPNKLPLVKNSLKMLLDTLDKTDSVAIVTYAGTAGTALEPTRIGDDKQKITGIIDNLGAGGSTAGAEGIRQAYELTKRNFDKEGVNRVILATDGDFNVGITDVNELKSFIERQRESGIYLSVLGFGMGNYNDRMMQALAQNGNGNAAYIDTLNEARKTLVEEAGSTLFPIAKDVKIQVEFNPAKVAEYRLIGYETRLLQREDFNNDKVDAGDIGSGHTVTALYEITPVGSKSRLVDDLRYQPKSGKETPPAGKNDEYAFVKIRYKLPDSDTSTLITTSVDGEREYRALDEVPEEARFAASVAAFGQLLRGADHLRRFGYDDVLALAEKAKGADAFGYRAEFLNLVRLARNAPGLPAQLR